MTIYLNLGANLGDRYDNLCRATQRLAAAFAGCVVRATQFIVSEPWGYASDNLFVNRGVAIDAPCDIDPFEVLRRCQAVERSISDASHRDASGAYADRLIDIDIIMIDDITIDSEQLTLPHPRMRQRPFVMIPLQQLLQNPFGHPDRH